MAFGYETTNVEQRVLKASFKRGISLWLTINSVYYGCLSDVDCTEFCSLEAMPRGRGALPVRSNNTKILTIPFPA